MNTTPTTTHFNGICPSIDYLKIVPFEYVRGKITSTFMCLLDKKYIHLQREKIWIRKLNMTPLQAREINTLVKTFHDTVQLKKIGNFRKFQFLAVYKRNKTLKITLFLQAYKEMSTT